MIQNGKEQVVDGIHIYPTDYFNPLDSITGKLTKTSNTYSLHWYDASWIKQSALRKKLARLYHRLLKIIEDKAR